MSITKETRLESYIKTPTAERKKMILAVLGDKQMTARMIAQALGFSDLNAVKPRLTEMKNDGTVEVVGKAYDSLTDRNVALFQKTKSAQIN